MWREVYLLMRFCKGRVQEKKEKKKKQTKRAVRARVKIKLSKENPISISLDFSTNNSPKLESIL